MVFWTEQWQETHGILTQLYMQHCYLNSKAFLFLLNLILDSSHSPKKITPTDIILLPERNIFQNAQMIIQ